MKPNLGTSASSKPRDFLSTEAARLTLLVCGTLWLLHAYLTPRLLGGGDARWYHLILADAVTQFRAGVFPVFVGQTDFAFNGAVFPLRVAPYYQYFAGFLDLITGRSLSFIGLQNLTVVLSFVAGALSAYKSLVWLAPEQRWSATLLALLYVMCPGVLGLLYAQDLYMSCMTIPWVPPAVAAMVRWSDDKADAHAGYILAASLAALWWGHSPIAFWASLIAVTTQIVRLLFSTARKTALVQAAKAALSFGALASYPIVSVVLLRDSIVSQGAEVVERESLLREVGAAFPGSVLPLDAAAPPLTHLQLGYGLASVLLCSTLALCFVSVRRARAVAPLLLIGGFLLVLVLPVPFVTRALWYSFPDFVTDITLIWPMQRLYVLVAAITIVGAQSVLRDTSVRLPSGDRVIPTFLAVAALWGAKEASKLIALAQTHASPAADTRRLALPENVAIQSYSYSFFSGRPPYFSHGVVDPRLEFRLLDAASGELLKSNYDQTDSPPLTDEFRGEIDVNPGILNLTPKFTLEPGKRYKLTFDFLHSKTAGVLQVLGPGFFREYALPLSGEAKAFGVPPGAAKSLALWTSSQTAQIVSLRFIPTAEGATPLDFIPFARYRFAEDDPSNRHVRVDSLLPISAEVHSRGPALLETPRLFVAGYSATVNGARVPVLKSSAGLASLPVPAGTSKVALRFVGSMALNAAFWLSFLAWIGGVTWLGLRLTGLQFGRRST